MTEERPKVKPSFLTDVVRRKAAEVAARSRRVPLVEMRARAADAPPARAWKAALVAGTRPAVIAEIKRRSPSAGPLAPGLDAARRARLYVEGGAAAVSVLTDAAFDGALGDLRDVREAVEVPVLRKDFLVDPWQVWESRVAGADAALVIVAAVDDASLVALAGAARDAGLALLVEVHAVADEPRALAIDPATVGVNARDLASLDVSFDRMLVALGRLRERAGPDVALVAESGIAGPDDARRAVAAGADAVLVGEHLVTAADPRAAVAALTGGSPS